MGRARELTAPPRLRILGPLEVEGAPRTGGPKQRVLLATLLLAPNAVVSHERLIDAVWGEEPPGSAPHALQVYVSQLRKSLPPPTRIDAVGDGYRLTVDESEVDASAFARLAERGRRLLVEGEPAAAAAALREALALWRGPIEALPQADPEVGRLEELRVATVEDRVEAELALGRHAALVPELEALVRAHPLRERLRRHQMLALYRSGRQADALEAYRDARRMLVDELGLEPTLELRELEAAILRHDPALAVEPTEVRERRRLPAPATELIGRAREIGDVATLLRGPARLVTLTGPGGSGKTRLALQVAHELAGDFADGARFVGLGALTEPALVLPEVAAAFGVDDGGGSLAEALVRHLRDRSTLLLADNFEQVDAAAPELAALLRAAPAIRLLVTSRHPLRLYGEHEYPVPPLDEQDAVALFVARARAARHGFVASEAVRELCGRLDRLPLAIELAAARVRDLSVGELLESVPRLEAASEGPRDVPARHRTLRATIEWSHDLLAPPDRGAFARLGIFAGGWAPEAAAAVVDADASTLETLAERSLIVRGERFSMLETIREYALERLHPHDAVADRHAAYFLELAELADARIRGGDEQAEWLARLDDEHDNLRAAIAHAAATDADAELRLATALAQFWEWRGHTQEGAARLEAALGRNPGRADALAARALRRASVFAQLRGDAERADELARGALAVARQLGDDELTANAIRKVASLAKDAGDYERARRLHDEALALSRDAGDERGISSSLINLADLALAAGRADEAYALSGESVELAKLLGDRMRELTSLLNLGQAALRLGRRRDAAAAFESGAALAGALRNVESVAVALVGVAALSDDAPRAARLLGAADALLERAGGLLEPGEGTLRDETVAVVRSRLPDADAAAAEAEGRALALDAAVAEASEAARALGASLT